MSAACVSVANPSPSHAGALSRILSSPTGAEVSGPSFQWSGGGAYLTWVAQHPQDFEGNKLPRDAPEVRVRQAGAGQHGEVAGATLLLDTVRQL